MFFVAQSWARKEFGSLAERVSQILVTLPELGHRGEFLPQHLDLERVGGRFDVIGSMLPSGNGEHLVKLFQRKSLGLRDEEQNTNPANETPHSVPGERALVFETCAQHRPGEGEDEIEGPRGGGSERHTDFTYM